MKEGEGKVKGDGKKSDCKEKEKVIPIEWGCVEGRGVKVLELGKLGKVKRGMRRDKKKDRNTNAVLMRKCGREM